MASTDTPGLSLTVAKLPGFPLGWITLSSQTSSHSFLYFRIVASTNHGPFVLLIMIHLAAPARKAIAAYERPDNSADGPNERSSTQKTDRQSIVALHIHPMLFRDFEHL